MTTKEQSLTWKWIVGRAKEFAKLHSLGWEKCYYQISPEMDPYLDRELEDHPDWYGYLKDMAGEYGIPLRIANVKGWQHTPLGLAHQIYIELGPSDEIEHECYIIGFLSLEV